ncbi:hypothetical protein D3C73_1530440 [compost metagenome]
MAFTNPFVAPLNVSGMIPRVAYVVPPVSSRRNCTVDAGLPVANVTFNVTETRTTPALLAINLPVAVS